MNKGQEIRKKSLDDSIRQCKGPCGKLLPKTEEFFHFRKSNKNGKMYASPSCLICERARSSENRRARYASADGKAKIQAQNAEYKARQAAKVTENPDGC